MRAADGDRGVDAAGFRDFVLSGGDVQGRSSGDALVLGIAELILGVALALAQNFFETGIALRFVGVCGAHG